MTFLGILREPIPCHPEVHRGRYCARCNGTGIEAYRVSPNYSDGTRDWRVERVGNGT